MNLRAPRYALALSIAACLALFMLAQCASAFQVCRDATVRLTLIESPAPNVECAAIAAEHGAVGAAVLMMVSPTPACAVWSAGRGWIVAFPGVADYVIGREARHALWQEDYAVAGLPVFGECGR